MNDILCMRSAEREHDCDQCRKGNHAARKACYSQGIIEIPAVHGRPPGDPSPTLPTPDGPNRLSVANPVHGPVRNWRYVLAAPAARDPMLREGLPRSPAPIWHARLQDGEHSD